MIPKTFYSSHAPAWEFILHRSSGVLRRLWSVNSGIPTPERGNDTVMLYDAVIENHDISLFNDI
jgi:succinate dehydrogenase/fumarate reductase cytochrome b subunit